MTVYQNIDIEKEISVWGKWICDNREITAEIAVQIERNSSSFWCLWEICLDVHFISCIIDIGIAIIFLWERQHFVAVVLTKKVINKSLWCVNLYITERLKWNYFDNLDFW